MNLRQPAPPRTTGHSSSNMGRVGTPRRSVRGRTACDPCFDSSPWRRRRKGRTEPLKLLAYRPSPRPFYTGGQVDRLPGKASPSNSRRFDGVKNACSGKGVRRRLRNAIPGNPINGGMRSATVRAEFHFTGLELEFWTAVEWAEVESAIATGSMTPRVGAGHGASKPG